MARWKLTAKHYLNVPGTEWEHEETNRDTGKKARKRFAVPLYLDPDDPEFQNGDGEVVVAYEGSPHRKDVIFVGLPTPDMEPLDDEARAISDAERPKWIHAIDSLPAQGGMEFSQSLLTLFERQMGEIASKAGVTSVPNTVAGVSRDEFEALKEQLASLAARNAELEAGNPSPARRV